MDNTNFVITLSSPAFSSVDTINAVKPYDVDTSTPLTEWSILDQEQDTDAMTITALFKTGDGMPITFAPGTGPLVTGTIVITTTGGVTAPVAVKPVTIDPCAG